MGELVYEKGRAGKILLEGRSIMHISGVSEVESFDEESVRLTTCDGELLVEGSNIKIGALDTERGEISLGGRIDGIYYASDPRESGGKKGFFGRLVR